MIPKPLFSQRNKEDCESAPSAEQDSLDSTFPDISDLDSPEAAVTPSRLSRIAKSLGCEPEAGSPAWETSLETPEGQWRKGSDKEELKPEKKKLPPKSLFKEKAKDAAVKNNNSVDLLEMAAVEDKDKMKNQ